MEKSRNSAAARRTRIATTANIQKSANNSEKLMPTMSAEDIVSKNPIIAIEQAEAICFLDKAKIDFVISSRSITQLNSRVATVLKEAGLVEEEEQPKAQPKQVAAPAKAVSKAAAQPKAQPKQKIEEPVESSWEDDLDDETAEMLDQLTEEDYETVAKIKQPVARKMKIKFLYKKMIESNTEEEIVQEKPKATKPQPKQTVQPAAKPVANNKSLSSKFASAGFTPEDIESLMLLDKETQDKIFNMNANMGIKRIQIKRAVDKLNAPAVETVKEPEPAKKGLTDEEREMLHQLDNATQVKILNQPNIGLQRIQIKKQYEKLQNAEAPKPQPTKVQPAVKDTATKSAPKTNEPSDIDGLTEEMFKAMEAVLVTAESSYQQFRNVFLLQNKLIAALQQEIHELKHSGK